MTRSIKGAKGPGHEYWGRRPGKNNRCPGRDSKSRTHRAERRQGKEAIRFTDPNQPEGEFG